MSSPFSTHLNCNFNLPPSPRGQTGLSRRRFVSACAMCMGCGAAAFLKPLAASAAPRRLDRPRIRVVFGETPNDQPIWPNINYDFDSRRKQLFSLLARGCPDLDFVTTRLNNDAKEADAVLAADAEVDGYIICVQGLGWNNDIFKLSMTGKPTLIVDNLFGGSGLFLREIARIMSSGKPVGWISSSKERDMVEAARQFSGLYTNQPASEIAAGFRATRRQSTPPVTNWSCRNDPVQFANLDEAMKQLRETRILVVGGGWGGDEFRKASQETTGVEFVPIAFEELAAAHAQASPGDAKLVANYWIEKAEKIDSVDRDVIEGAGAMYVGMRALMEKHRARGISINCLGGFYGGHLKAYPCLGFSHLNDNGLVGGCEADQMSALTMAVMGAVTGRPGFISDPVIDTSKNAIIYAHCVAMTKPFGPDGRANAYHIMTHSEDRKGASIRSFLPVGYMTTTLELNPTTREVLMHQARSSGNNPSDMACRTKLEASVKGDIEKLTEHWSMGWHRVTFYGDLKPHVEELCQRLGFKLVQEA